MNEDKLKLTIKRLFVEGKGILATDESIDTATKRLESIGVESNVENRRRYRELFLSAENVENFISGIILADETFWQKNNNGENFSDDLIKKGILSIVIKEIL